MSIFNRKTSGNKRTCEQSDSESEYISEKQIMLHSEKKDEEIIQKIQEGGLVILNFLPVIKVLI